MADWQRKIDLEEQFKLYDEAEISVQEICKEIVRQLLALPKFEGAVTVDDEKLYLVQEFEELSEWEEDCDSEELEDEINYLMNKLYDWGDISLDGKFGGKKVCWIKTRF